MFLTKSIHGSMHVNTFTCFRSLARTSQLLKYVHDFSRWLDERMSLTYIIYMLQIPRWLPPDIFLSVTGLPRGVSVLQDFIIIMTRLGWLRIYTYTLIDRDPPTYEMPYIFFAAMQTLTFTKWLFPHWKLRIYDTGERRERETKGSPGTTRHAWSKKIELNTCLDMERQLSPDVQNKSEIKSQVLVLHICNTYLPFIL